MSDVPNAAQRAARAIQHGSPVPVDDPQARAYAEAFYSLAALLPPATEGSPSRPPRHDAEDARRPKARRVTLYAIVLCTVIALALALALRQPDRFDPQGAIFLVPTAAAPTARGVVLITDDRLLLFASGLSQLESGYRYVLWRVDSGGHHRIGSVVALGSGRVRLHAGLREEPSRLEVTIERSTATGAPTGPTVLAGLREPQPQAP